MPETPVAESPPTERPPSPTWSRVGARVGGGVLGLLVLLLVVGRLLPGRYRVERSIVVEASPAAVSSVVADLRTWPEWSAWSADRHPSLEFEFSGPASGVGAKQAWTADEGSGTLTLTESDPGTGIAYIVQFVGDAPMRGQFELEGLVDPAGRTRVTWIVEGDLGRSPLARWFGLGIDSAIGADLEIGLEGLQRRLAAE